MSKVSFIQLARHGDLASAFPFFRAKAKEIGGPVDVLVHPDFTDLFEAVMYARPVPHPTTHSDVMNAAARARKMGYDEVIACQVSGNERLPQDQDNFIAQQWQWAGYLEQFHELPLVFDRRDLEGEAEAIARYLPLDDGRPLLCYALDGVSCPLFKRDAFAWWLQHFGDQYRLLDVGQLRLPKVHHVLGLLERADALVTIDTLHVILAHAFGTPTISLVDDRCTWFHSEPRKHLVHRMTYAEALTDEGQREITRILREQDFAPGRLVREPSKMRREPIYHVVDWHCPESDRPRVLNARRTWEEQRNDDRHWIPVWWVTGRDAARTSSDLADDRTLPYLRDILDRAVKESQAGGSPDGIICYTNADSCLVSETAQAIREALQDAPCAFSRRVNLSDTSAPTLKRHEIAWLRPDLGYDLFAFRASWWKARRLELPDALIGCEGWDWCFAQQMLRDNPAAEINPPLVYHRQHAPVWSYSNVRLHSPAQRHNRKVCAAWARANGHSRLLADEPYLFKPEPIPA